MGDDRVQRVTMGDDGVQRVTMGDDGMKVQQTCILLYLPGNAGYTS